MNFFSIKIHSQNIGERKKVERQERREGEGTKSQKKGNKNKKFCKKKLKEEKSPDFSHLFFFFFNEDGK